MVWCLSADMRGLQKYEKIHKTLQRVAKRCLTNYESVIRREGDARGEGLDWHEGGMCVFFLRWRWFGGIGNLTGVLTYVIRIMKNSPARQVV